MKKLFYLLFLFLFMVPCENIVNTINVPNKNSVEKHFVSIEQIKQIVENKPFKNFLSKLVNNEMIKINDVNGYFGLNSFTALNDSY